MASMLLSLKKHCAIVPDIASTYVMGRTRPPAASIRSLGKEQWQGPETLLFNINNFMKGLFEAMV